MKHADRDANADLPTLADEELDNVRGGLSNVEATILMVERFVIDKRLTDAGYTVPQPAPAAAPVAAPSASADSPRPGRSGGRGHRFFFRRRH